MNTKWYLYMLAFFACIFAALPCLYYGFVLAQKINSLAVAPVPAMAVIILAGIFGHQAENHV